MSKKPGKKSDVISEEMWEIIEQNNNEILNAEPANLLILITQIKKRHEEIVNEVANAEKELKEVELFDVESYGLQRKTEEIGDNYKTTLKNIDQVEMQYEEKLRKMSEEKAKDLTGVKKTYLDEIAKKDKEIDDLEKKYIDISGFSDREKTYYEQIVLLEKKFKELEEVHTEEIKKLEKMFSNQRVQAEKDYQYNIDEIMRNAHLLAEMEAIDSEKLVERQNKKLMGQLGLQKVEVDHIKFDHFQITKDNLSMKQKMNNNHSILKDFKNINHKQTMKIKKLNEKIDYLKKYISTEVVKYTKELELLKNSNAKSIYESEYQVKSLREQIKMKNKEIKTLKSLVQMILDQRSDIEEFFLEAWDQVSKEVMERRKEHNPINLPDISKSSKSSLVSSEKNSEMKEKRIRIKELDLEDRDKIMRIIFAKINAGTQPIAWRKCYDSVKEPISEQKYYTEEEENKINTESKNNQFSSFEN